MRRGVGALLFAAAVLPGCGASSTVDPVAQAASATTQAGGARMALVVRLAGAGAPAGLTVTASGFFNTSSRDGSMSMDVSGLPASAARSLAAGTHVDMVFKGTAFYMRSPLLTSRLPGGKHWLKVDLSKLTGRLGLSAQQLTSGQSNPAQLLQYLKASGGVTRVGSDTIRGVPATHYRGSIDLRKLPAALGQNTKVDQLIAEIGSSALPVDVWIDAHHLVRRMQMTFGVKPSGATSPLNVAMTIDVFGFGPTPAVSAPAASDVYDVPANLLPGTSG
jgi:hypothetical protein